jgi:hypothetical protein
MISPTIGRVVLVNVGAAQPHPALVCFVHSDRLINVGGFDGNGQPFAATDLVLLQDDDEPPAEGSYAEWMPYQKTAAASATTSGTPAYDARFDIDVLTQRTEQLATSVDSLTGRLDNVDMRTNALEDVAHTPSETETKAFSDGTTATGPGPLPDQSPAQQDAAASAEGVPG